jgi:hypothetical protein
MLYQKMAFVHVANKKITVNSDEILGRVSNTIMKLNSKKVYWRDVEQITKQPSAITHWISEFIFLHDNDFGDIFLLAHHNCDVKLQCFQYKILNRIFPCNYMLNKWGIVTSVRCCYCDNIDTLEHYFFYCKTCDNFWKCITEWFKVIFQAGIPLTIVNILMGIPHMKTQDELLSSMNFIILHGKWYIYLCKREEKELKFAGFCKYLKHVLRMEIIMTGRKNNKYDIHAHWEKIMMHL